MVEGVEGIHLEQELNALRDAELLAYGCIKVIDTRLAIVVTREVAKRAKSGLDEAVWIEARELAAGIAMDVAARREIRVHELAEVDTLNVIRLHSERETALEGDDAAKLPAANCEIYRPVDLIPELLTTAEG